MLRVAKQKPRTAASRSKDLLRAEQKHRLRMAEQLLSVILAFAKDQGLSRAQCRRACQNAQANIDRHRIEPGAGVRFAALLQISDILAVWYRDPAFLDKTGRPRALSLSGTDSFATLAKRFLPEFEPSEVASTLIAEQLLQRRPNRRVAPKHRAAVFATLNPMMLERIPVLVKGLVSTFGHNAEPAARKSGTRCDQSTHLARLPLELLPAFNAHVKRLAQVLLDSADSWAQPRLLSPESPASLPTANVGVEVFSFVDNDTYKPTRKRPQSSR